MFKFKSYNIKKAEGKNEISSSSSSSSSSSKTTAPSYSTGTLKKTTSSSSKTTVPSYSTGTLKKTTSSSYVSPKKKTMPSAAEIKAVSDKHPPPEYSTKIYPKKTVTNWQNNKTYSAKNETKKVVIPSPHKKLERK